MNDILTKELLCITCPNGCALTVRVSGDDIEVAGNKCPRGITFAREELTRPMRTMTTLVRTAYPNVPVIPVRTEHSIPKDRVLAAAAELAAITIDRPLRIGDAVADSAAGYPVRVIVTSNALWEASHES